MSGSAGGHFDSPVPSTHDRDSIGVKWNAHDDNDDQLVYSVYYRGDGETRWLLLKDNLTDKAYSFEASLLPGNGLTGPCVQPVSYTHLDVYKRQGLKPNLDNPAVEALLSIVRGQFSKKSSGSARSKKSWELREFLPSQ